MLLKTTNLQNSASNPENSVFVSASAGSGKTKVLTDRVLRLLLSGVAPAKILCLTFTKVAAAQMQNRIFSELENWLIWDDEKLKNHLQKFIQKSPSELDIKSARKLFATLLDDNSGLQISTIHSFCQSIIKKFPVEAKTSPSFSIIDEQKENLLLFDARKQLLKEALNNENLATKIRLISARLNEDSFLEITAEIIKKRQNLAELKDKYFGIENVIEEVYSQLGVSLKEDEGTALAKFIEDKNWQKAELLEICNSTQIKSKAEISSFIDQPILENLADYLSVFLTSENEPRKQLTTKLIQKQMPKADEIMQAEQIRVFQFLEEFHSVKIAVATSSLLIVVDKIIEIYSTLKNQNGYLDYSDLIIKTSQLLENSANREWVKYKLDGIYEHILVDESQDTNHQQWNIVKAITEEFFSGNSAKIEDRTIFIVGDEKQSIYSFQGADPNIFANIFYYYQEKLGLINERFLNVELNSSFRSLPAILQVVDKVFTKPQLAEAISSLTRKIEHHAIKNHHFGKVELLPIVAINKTEKVDGYTWNLDFTANEEYKAQEILAQIIAKKIKKFFVNKKFLAGKNRLAEFGDVMILLKERKSDFGDLLVKYLQSEQIPVSSADRIDFSNNIIVQDLLALAKFILLPEDDLNLACLLKSPMFSLSEENLLAICNLKNQQKISLFAALQQHCFDIYQELMDLMLQNSERQFSVGEFFSYVLIENCKIKPILARFGKVGEEIINQFLKICFDYQSNNISASLQNFVQFLESSDLTIKIDSVNQNKNQVYITTVHSAKGLEAPIVFLADTFHTPQKQVGNDKRRIFWHKETGLPFWSGGKDFDNSLLKKIKKNEREISQKEYWRQLYVAMTRAEEELYVCGFGKDKFDQDCWYNVVKEAMIDKAKTAELIDDYQDYLVGGSGLVFGEDFTPNFSNELLIPNLPSKNERLIINQNFIKEIPEKEFYGEFLQPSQLNLQNLNQETFSKVKVGKIIHKILEFLPDLKIENTEERRTIILKYLEQNDLNPAEAEEILARIDNVLEKYADLFSNPNSKSEVPIIAKINGRIISARIDRLIILENEVLIIDFKTGKKNQHYQSQMQLYEQVLQKLYPNKKIKSEIVWV